MISKLDSPRTVAKDSAGCMTASLEKITVVRGVGVPSAGAWFAGASFIGA